MNRTRHFRIFVLAISILMLSACTLAPQSNTLERMSERGAGYDGGQPRALSNEPKTHFEQRVKSIPGISDASVIFYGTDTLVIAVDTAGETREEIVEDKVRQELQGETRDYLIYVVHDKEYPDLHAKVKEMSQRIEQGRPVKDEELREVVNDAWRTIVPFNFGN